MNPCDERMNMTCFSKLEQQFDSGQLTINHEEKV